MKKIPSQTEQELQELNPCKLDEDFMARLAACADGVALELTPDELAFEESLRSVSPSRIQNSFSFALAEAVNDTPFSVDEKIVLFHKSSSRNPEPGTSRFRRVMRSNFAAAAAVALLGAFTALMLPGQKSGEPQVTEMVPDKAPSRIVPVGNQFAPASYDRNLRDTRDEGVIWRGGNQPHRVLRFKYMDRVTLKNEKGEAVEVERPREEIVIIPEKLD
jgi:hypothetical protein